LAATLVLLIQSKSQTIDYYLLQFVICDEAVYPNPLKIPLVYRQHSVLQLAFFYETTVLLMKPNRQTMYCYLLQFATYDEVVYLSPLKIPLVYRQHYVLLQDHQATDPASPLTNSNLWTYYGYPYVITG
jgi:hypothetical protein